MFWLVFPTLPERGDETADHEWSDAFYRDHWPLVFAKARRLDLPKLKVAETEFRSLEAASTIMLSDSPWSSPLHNAHGTQERQALVPLWRLPLA